MFPILRDVYDVGYTELGLAISVFNLTAAFTQAPIGFLVDRYGPSNFLIAGLIAISSAFALIGVFPSYSALLVLMVFAGLANAVFHPADYAVLSATINKRYMGRAFSLHTFSGFLGQAISPITIIFLVGIVGWRTALVICGLFGLAGAALLALNAGVLRNIQVNRSGPLEARRPQRSGWGLLFSLPVVMGLAFFASISMAGQGINGFSVSSLHLIYQAPISEVAFVLSAYLLAAPLGVLVGGWLADRTSRHDLNVTLCFLVAALAVGGVAAFELSLVEIAGLFVLAGFCTGMVPPSRDMLIRSVTPAGDMGKVFGFVSTGFNLGNTVAPVMYGYLLDHGDPRIVFWVVSGFLLLTIATVLTTGRVGRQARVGE